MFITRKKHEAIVAKANALIDFAGDWMRGGCLTWHAANGKVVSPDDVAATPATTERGRG